MVEVIECDVLVVCEWWMKMGKRIVMFLVRRRSCSSEYKEIRIMMLGNVDFGKLMVLGVFIKGGLDNG